jgi:hypothetical protein
MDSGYYKQTVCPPPNQASRRRTDLNKAGNALPHFDTQIRCSQTDSSGRNKIREDGSQVIVKPRPVAPLQQQAH